MLRHLFVSFFDIFIRFQRRNGGSNRFPAALRVYCFFFHPKRKTNRLISITFSPAGLHRPVVGPRAHELVGPRVWATKCGAGQAPTAHGGPRVRATISGAGQAPTALGPTGPRARGPTSSGYQIWTRGSTNRPRAHRPTSSWAHELGARNLAPFHRRPVLETL